VPRAAGAIDVHEVAAAEYNATLVSYLQRSPEIPMFVLARAVTYATLFIGLLLVFVPGRIL
jgi:hypothetical protein